MPRETAIAIPVMMLLCLLIAIPAVSAGTVTRSFSNDTQTIGSLLKVTLTVDVTGGSQEYYSIEEEYPASWEIVSNGGMNSSQTGFLKTIVYRNAEDKQYVYSLRVPSNTSTYEWGGLYFFRDMEDEQEILGQKYVTVIEGCPDADGDLHFNMTCGGDDPDDNDDTIYPGAPELCDNKDNDIDGYVDENLTRQCGQTDVGECSYGSETCNAGAWEGCDAVNPVTEVCGDGKDNDCDGSVDDGCDGDGGAGGGADTVQDTQDTGDAPQDGTSSADDSCTEDWSCGEWSACHNGQQSRSCTDQNNCGTSNDKPADTQGCSGEAIIPGLPLDVTDINTIGPVISVVSVVVIVIVILVRRRSGQYEEYYDNEQDDTGQDAEQDDDGQDTEQGATYT